MKRIPIREARGGDQVRSAALGLLALLTTAAAITED